LTVSEAQNARGREWNQVLTCAVKLMCTPGGPPSIIWFKRCFHDKSDDEVCERTKNAANIWANSWYADTLWPLCERSVGTLQRLCGHTG